MSGPRPRSHAAQRRATGHAQPSAGTHSPDFVVDDEMDSAAAAASPAAAPTHASAAAVGSKRRRGGRAVGDAAGADFGDATHGRSEPAAEVGGGDGGVGKRRRVDSPPTAAVFKVWVKLSRVEGASFASVKLDSPPATVDDLRAAIMAARRMDVDPSLVTLRLVHLGPGGREDDEPTAAEEAAAATLKPRYTLTKAGVSDGAFLLLDVASTAAAGPALLPPDDDTARIFAALAEGRVVEQVLTRTLPDGTQRPITVLRLPDGLKWKHADSDTLLVRHFYDDLYTHVLHRLQPRAVQRERHYVITGNPGVCTGEGACTMAERGTLWTVMVL